jgi:acyl-coenzyme A synthetase/AMP-(fatty) acid ligase
MPSMSILQLPKVLVSHMTSKEIVWFCNSKRNGEYRDRENLSKEINQHISDHIGPIAKLDKIQICFRLPKPVLENASNFT